jgi:hypothetical protein
VPRRIISLYERDPQQVTFASFLTSRTRILYVTFRGSKRASRGHAAFPARCVRSYVPMWAVAGFMEIHEETEGGARAVAHTPQRSRVGEPVGAAGHPTGHELLMRHRSLAPVTVGSMQRFSNS